jgi:hypothetical protein
MQIRDHCNCAVRGGVTSDSQFRYFEPSRLDADTPNEKQRDHPCNDPAHHCCHAVMMPLIDRFRGLQIQING